MPAHIAREAPMQVQLLDRAHIGRTPCCCWSARRHHVQAKADALLTVLRAPGLRQTPTLEGRLRGDRRDAGRHHHRAQRADHAAARGVGRTFWPTPVR